MVRGGANRVPQIGALSEWPWVETSASSPNQPHRARHRVGPQAILRRLRPAHPLSGRPLGHRPTRASCAGTRLAVAFDATRHLVYYLMYAFVPVACPRRCGMRIGPTLLGVCLVVLALGGAVSADGLFREGALIAGGQIVPLYGDSGCISVQCSRSCLYNTYTYRCSTTATFRRYDDQMNGLPLRVAAIADCTAVTVGFWSCYRSTSATGSGRVTARAWCYITTPFPFFAGVCVTEGDCLCEEL
jgi:hypothetical protein